MAQLVEHILGKDEVPSSNLGSSSRQPRCFNERRGFGFLLELLSCYPVLAGDGYDSFGALNPEEHACALHSSNLVAAQDVPDALTSVGALAFYKAISKALSSTRFGLS